MTSLPIRLIKSRTGVKTAEINGIMLHSAYDPEKEAARFIGRATGTGEKNPATILLLGAGLGYLTAELRRRYPAARLIAFYYHEAVFREAEFRSSLYWHPGMNTTPGEFLRQNLDELGLKGLFPLKWSPGSRIFPGVSGSVETAVSHVLKEISGSYLTSLSMGKLWIRNSFSNFLYTEQLYPILPTGNTVILAGSGPSLEDSIEFIAHHRNKLDLWALPSALACLGAGGIVPDRIVMTDPGYYSFYHLKSLAAAKTDSNIIMPLSAVTGVWKLPLRTAFLLQPNFFEQELLAWLSERLNKSKGLPSPFPEVPPRGTVAATALELALAVSTGILFVTGLDFCYKDIKSHGAPNTFRELQELAAHRLTPFYSNAYTRAREYAPVPDTKTGNRSSRPLITYAGWFNDLDTRKKQRMRKIEGRWKNHFDIQGISPGDAKEILARKTEKTKTKPQPFTGYPPFGQRLAAAREIIASWQRMIAAEDKLCSGGAYNPVSLLNNKILKDLAYFTDLDRLNRINYLTGQEKRKAAVDGVKELLLSMGEFLTGLHERMRGDQISHKRERTSL